MTAYTNDMSNIRLFRYRMTDWKRAAGLFINIEAIIWHVRIN